MRYGLEMLPMLLSMGPPVLVGVASTHATMVFALVLLVILVPLVIAAFVWKRRAEADLRAAGVDLSALAMAYDDTDGRRPGQFGISGLLVVMMLAAIALAIIRLPIPELVKIFALTALWIGFMFWQMRNLKHALSPTGRFNMAVTNLVGEALIIAMFAWIMFGFNRLKPLSYFDFAFFGILVIGPALRIRRSIKTMRQAISAGKKRPAV